MVFVFFIICLHFTVHVFVIFTAIYFLCRLFYETELLSFSKGNQVLKFC